MHFLVCSGGIFLYDHFSSIRSTIFHGLYIATTLYINTFSFLIRLACSLRQTKAATTIQKHFRGYTKRKAFLRMRSAAIKIQCLVRGVKARKLQARLLYEQKTLVIQRYWRLVLVFY